ncbi:hypothetical protein [Faecalispora jeddahensis]|uniref:hypothetical protein n=1 Tax=Faecalispora jeddahensis TaxID=1414721 RepID=UPI001897EF4F|nr:hypothetical protein [Faecalispora jeddahensis]
MPGKVFVSFGSILGFSSCGFAKGGILFLSVYPSVIGEFFLLFEFKNSFFCELPYGEFLLAQSFAPRAGAGTYFRERTKVSKGLPKDTFGIRSGNKFWNATPTATEKALQ